MAERPLTQRQESILRFIQEYTKNQGAPPTLREMGAHFGIRSTNGVNDHLRALERKGFIVRAEMKSRGIRVTSEGGAVVTSTLRPARDERLEPILTQMLFLRRRIDQIIDALYATGIDGGP